MDRKGSLLELHYLEPDWLEEEKLKKSQRALEKRIERRSADLLSPDAASDGAKTDDEGSVEDFTKGVIRDFIVTDLEVKELPVSVVCDNLNAVLDSHLEDIGLAGAGFGGLKVAPDTDASKTKLFFHVRNVSLESLLDLISAQTGLIYEIEGGEIMLAYPDAD